MLKVLIELWIELLGVISVVIVEFDCGFIVLIGEIGIGKIMVVIGLYLFGGVWVDVICVWFGVDCVVVEGCFIIIDFDDVIVVGL